VTTGIHDDATMSASVKNAHAIKSEHNIIRIALYGTVSGKTLRKQNGLTLDTKGNCEK
jgi:hypothetical protein